MAEFLTDETGSVRWLCFEITKIDWKYYTDIDINMVWAQARDLLRSGYECEMSIEDIMENENRNSKFQQLSAEAEIIPNFLIPSDEKSQESCFCTSTDILLYLSSFTTMRLNKISIGKAMPLCGFHRVKNSQVCASFSRTNGQARKPPASFFQSEVRLAEHRKANQAAQLRNVDEPAQA